MKKWIAISLLIPSLAWSQFTIGRHKGGSAAASNPNIRQTVSGDAGGSFLLPLASLSGDAIVIISSTVSTPTDTRGNTYTQLCSLSDAPNVYSVYLAVNIAAGANTVTLDSNGSIASFSIIEVTGIQASPLDGSAVCAFTNFAYPNPVAVGPITLTTNDFLINALFLTRPNGNTSMTASATGYASLATSTFGQVSGAQVTSGSYSPSWTYSGSPNGTTGTVWSSFQIGLKRP